MVGSCSLSEVCRYLMNDLHASPVAGKKQLVFNHLTLVDESISHLKIKQLKRMTKMKLRATTQQQEETVSDSVLNQMHRMYRP